MPTKDDLDDLLLHLPGGRTLSLKVPRVRILHLLATRTKRVEVDLTDAAFIKKLTGWEDVCAECEGKKLVPLRRCVCGIEESDHMPSESGDHTWEWDGDEDFEDCPTCVRGALTG
jgi:hypothetical protein